MVKGDREYMPFMAWVCPPKLSYCNNHHYQFVWGASDQEQGLLHAGQVVLLMSNHPQLPPPKLQQQQQTTSVCLKYVGAGCTHAVAHMWRSEDNFLTQAICFCDGVLDRTGPQACLEALFPVSHLADPIATFYGVLGSTASFSCCGCGRKHSICESQNSPILRVPLHPTPSTKL